MRLLTIASVAAALAAPLAIAAPSQAATAFQNWAQGRGTYVPSKERLDGFQDDLALYGVAPPPEESPSYRWRRLQERYGVVGHPDYDEGY